MMEMLRYMRVKLFKDEKGEVSVEWALVAIVMAIAIIGAFLPTVKTMLTNAITAVGTEIGKAGQ